MLRRRIDESAGVIALIGNSYGVEPPAPDESFGRVSYTQYETLYARESGKTLWPLVLAEDFKADPHEPEPEALRALQADFRARLQQDVNLYHSIPDSAALELHVHRIRQDLNRLRRGVKRWALVTMAIGIALAGSIGWLAVSQREGRKEVKQALVRLYDVERQGSMAGEKPSQDEQRRRAYSVLEKELSLPEGTLAKELPALALDLYGSKRTSVLMRAHAAFALNKFEEAQRLYLEAAHHEQRAMESAEKVAGDSRSAAIASFEAAGESARKLFQFQRAVDHYRAAAALTNRERNKTEWGRVQRGLAEAFYDQGKPKEAAELLRASIAASAEARGSEDPQTVSARGMLVNALLHLGRYAEAEREEREVLAIRLRQFEPDSFWILVSRKRVAEVLRLQGKLAEAETEMRQVLEIRKRELGAEHSQTLDLEDHVLRILSAQGKYAQVEKEARSLLAVHRRRFTDQNDLTMWCRSMFAAALLNLDRFTEAEPEIRGGLDVRTQVLGPRHLYTQAARTNLAQALFLQGKLTEAEKEQREALSILEEEVGPEHPETLNARTTLGRILAALGKYSDAEIQHRTALNIRERIMGPDVPETLVSRSNLATSISLQGRYAEAEKEHRATLEIQERMLAAEHPSALLTRNNLADDLAAQDKNAEAVQEYAAVLEIRQRLFGPIHSSVLAGRNGIAVCLMKQGRHADSETELREVLTLRERVLGAEHPDTLTTRSNLAECLQLQKKTGEAEQEHRRVLEGRSRALGEGHPVYFLSCYYLGVTLKDRGNLAEALKIASKGCDGLQQTVGLAHPHTKRAQALVREIESVSHGQNGASRPSSSPRRRAS